MGAVALGVGSRQIAVRAGKGRLHGAATGPRGARSLNDRVGPCDGRQGRVFQHAADVGRNGEDDDGLAGWDRGQHPRIGRRQPDETVPAPVVEADLHHHQARAFEVVGRQAVAELDRVVGGEPEVAAVRREVGGREAVGLAVAEEVDGVVQLLGAPRLLQDRGAERRMVVVPQPVQPAAGEHPGGEDDQGGEPGAHNPKRAFHPRFVA